MAAPTLAPAALALARWREDHGPVEATPHGVGAALASLVDAGLVDLPRPGNGATGARFDALAGVSRIDLSLGRLAEGHADARAVCAELGQDAPDGARLGVWAAEAPTARLGARRAPGGWRLDGRKAWCSGARVLSHVLVTAAAPDGPRLFLVDLGAPGVAPQCGTWPALGMAASDSLDVAFSGVPAVPVGQPGDYVGRRGFWLGSAGVAACWYGGAVAVAADLAAAVAARPDDPHALAHLGAVDAACAAMAATLASAAADLDRPGAGAKRVALRVRAVVEAGCAEVLARCGRATGAGPLARDAGHARRAADLTVYVRQFHAERDLADLGRLALADEERDAPGRA